MESNNMVILLIYYLGIASCAVQGAEKGKGESYIPILHSIVNAFGGGFMRDIIFLDRSPWLFTLSALPDIIWVVIIGCIYIYYFFIIKVSKKYYGVVMLIVSITDSLGLGSFICIGMDKAIQYSDNVPIIIICGYITAIGGGILANKKTFTELFRSKETVCYHFITLLGCCYYYIHRHALCLVCFSVVGLFLINNNYKVLYKYYFCCLMASCYMVFCLYPTTYNNNRFQKQRLMKVTKRMTTCLKGPKIYLIQHRIRQC